MEIGLIFLTMLGCLGIGYYLRFWHDAPELIASEAREAKLEQRIENLQGYYEARLRERR